MILVSLLAFNIIILNLQDINEKSGSTMMAKPLFLFSIF